MPTDDRPLRDVLQEVEALIQIAKCDRVNVSLSDLTRLARKLRAIAPLLRVALLYASAYDSAMPDADCRALDTLRALTDELEAK